MARALFGEELENAIETLNHQFWTVQVYVDANHRDKAGADAAFRRKIESTIWEGYPSPEENEVDQTIAAQVKTIEGICVPVLRLEARERDRRSWWRSLRAAILPRRRADASGIPAADADREGV